MDAKLSVTSSGVDLLLEKGDLAVDLGLSSTVLCSLFSDARATTDDGIAPTEDPRGVWADEPGDRWGSKLWLVERAKRIPRTAELARQYVLEALQWLVRDGVASAVRAEASFSDQGYLVIAIVVERSTDKRWSEVWKGLDEETFDVPGTTLRIFFR